MTLQQIKGYIADLAKAGFDGNTIITKARAMVDGQPIMDAEGNEVNIDLVDLATSMPMEENQGGGGEQLSASPDAIKKIVADAVKDAIAATRPTATGIVTTKDGQKSKPETMPAEARRWGALRHVRGPDADVKCYQFAHWLLAGFGHTKSVEYCRTHGIPLTKAQGESINTAGGFLVPPQFETMLIDLREQYGVFRRNAGIVRMSSDVVYVPRVTGDVTAYYVAENAAITESDQTFDQISLTARKIATLTRYSSELAEDALINVGDELAGNIAWAFAKKEDDAGFNGTGTSTYCGITGLAGKIVSGLLAYKTQGSSNTWSAQTLADFNNVVSLLPRYAYQAGNIKWYCSQAYWGQVMQRLALAAGGATAAEIVNGVTVDYFLGYPVEIVQVMPAATATTGVFVWFGNLALAAKFGDRRQTSIALSNDRYFEYDQIAIRGTERFDINVHEIGTASVAGPIVGLATG